MVSNVTLELFEEKGQNFYTSFFRCNDQEKKRKGKKNRESGQKKQRKCGGYPCFEGGASYKIMSGGSAGLAGGVRIWHFVLGTSRRPGG